MERPRFAANADYSGDYIFNGNLPLRKSGKAYGDYLINGNNNGGDYAEDYVASGTLPLKRRKRFKRGVDDVDNNIDFGSAKNL